MERIPGSRLFVNRYERNVCLASILGINLHNNLAREGENIKTCDEAVY
jgi:hypothetical protein